ncbi:MAG: GEVED domain-containing protein, partial [Bacteroidota bacterium]
APTCSGGLNQGNTFSTASSICANAIFSLSLQDSVLAYNNLYQWQSSPNGNTWTNIQNATNNTLTTSQTVATYYRCALTCPTNQSTGYSNPVHINMNAPTSCYCTPPVSTDGCSYMWVSNVSTSKGLSNFTNNSSCTPASYSDFSATKIASNMQLSSTTMSFTSTYNPLMFAVWIDYNDNGVFESTERMIFNENLNGTLTLTDSFTIPITAAPGTHRMRVRGDWYFDAATADPCNALTYGETEDYAFTVVAAPLCTGTPNPGNTVSSANPVCLGTSFTLSFQNYVYPAGINYQWQSSHNNTTWTNIQGATNAQLTISQSVNTYYRCSLTCISGMNTAFSNSIQVVMNPLTNCYCTPPASTYACGVMWISKVVSSGGISDFTNETACSPESYTNFSASYIASNAPLSATTLTLTSTGYPLGYSVWIDFNNNGVFESSERCITNNNANGESTITESFIVPATATQGIHKMRIRGEYFHYGAPTDPCNQLLEGETEDYAFNVIGCITPATPLVGTITQPTCETLGGSVVLSDLPALGNWTIQPGNISGTGTSTTISGLAAGTYNFTLTNIAGCTSAASANVLINLIRCITLRLFLEALYDPIANTMLEAQDIDWIAGETFAKYGIGVADRINVDLYEENPPYNPAGVSMNDINLSTDGLATFQISPTFNANYYIRVSNRNHLACWSALAVPFNTEAVVYDFSTNALNAYQAPGGNDPQAYVADGVYAFYLGDLDQSLNVDFDDFNLFEPYLNDGFYGFTFADFNGNALVDFDDFNLFEPRLNEGPFSQYPGMP